MTWTVGSPPPVWNNTQIIAQLGGDYYWAGATITFSFPNATTIFAGQGEAAGFSALSAAQQAKAVIAFALWDDLIARSITQTTANAGQIVLANSTTDDTGAVMGANGYAYTNSWTSGTSMTKGQVWFDSYYNGTTGGAGNNLMTPAIGLHGFSTFIHEIGHALGLDHMGLYNGSGDAATQASSYQDSTVYSIMSYFGPSWGPGITNGQGLVAWADWIGTDGKTYDPQTPMLNDVLAMQNIYGVDLTTRTGNTIYGFNSTLAAVEGGIYDFTQNAHPIMCLYDAGGIDTIDLSGYNTASNLDLNAGAFSDSNDMTRNISIAYTAVIENGTTGAGDDTLTGNAVANVLNGGGGDDTFNGGGGGDTFIGGVGNDIVTYASETVGLTIDMLTPANSTGNATGDSFNSVEKIIGTGLVDNIFGSNGNETIDGGVGNDILNGRGGNDAIIGGTGTDTAVFAGNFAAYAFNYNSGTSTYTVYNPDGSIDTVTGVENFQFADGVKTTAQLSITTGVPLRHITIGNLTPSQNEGNSGTTNYTFEVRLDGSAFSSQTVNYTIAGNGTNAANAADFSGVLSGTLTFAVGETVKTVTVAVIGDTIIEQNETFGLTLTSPTSGLVIDNVSATATIIDDDVPAVNVINGTASGETLNGLAGIDQINGLGGNDYLDGKAGADFLFGGDGDDQIVYDATDLAANINGGNGTDTLVVNGGTLPTGFNLVASAFENAVWTQTDSGYTQTWATNVSNYNSAWQLTRQDVVNDNGTRNVTNYDPTNAQTFASSRTDFDAAGRITLETVIYDGGSSYYASYDTSNTLAYAWYRNEYNATSQLNVQSISNDNGSTVNTVYDPGNAQIWTSIESTYNAAVQLVQQNVIYDDGTKTFTSYDITSTQSWATNVTSYNNAGQLTQQNIAYDNGTTFQQLNDTANAQSWATNQTTFNAAGQLTQQDVTYDNGSRFTASYDPANTQVWTSSRTDYNVVGQIVLSNVVYDDGSSYYVSYDTANTQEFAWYRNEYNAASQLTTQSLLHDNGSTTNTFYDPTNAQAWTTFQSEYNASSQITQQTINNDNGTNSLTVYDAANQFSWTEWHREYNASHVLINEFYV